MRNHIIHVCGATLAYLLLVAGINSLIDPYKIWNATEISGINKIKPKLEDHTRIYKTVGMASALSDTAILGTSRSEVGLNPSHPALGQNAINLATPGQPYLETRIIFDLLRDRKKINNFVIGLDFFPANIFSRNPPDFVNDNFKNNRSWQLRFSASVLMDSLSTIALQNVPLNSTFSEKGQLLLSDEHIKSAGGNRAAMNATLKGTMQGLLPSPSCSFKFDETSNSLSPLEEIRAVFARAQHEHIKLQLLISPSHARNWEILAALGLWDTWEEWKRRLVKMNEEEAQRANQPPFALWDFSGYNTITTETIPGLGDTNTLMHWYVEQSHYTSAAGDLVLDRIFNLKSTERAVPEDFGVLISSHNIKEHLADIRAARVHYLQIHPEDVAEIEAMAKEVIQAKRCN